MTVVAASAPAPDGSSRLVSLAHGGTAGLAYVVHALRLDHPGRVWPRVAPTEVFVDAWLPQLALRYAQALFAALPWLLGFAALVALLARVSALRDLGGRTRTIVVGSLAAMAAVRALQQAWVCDDAFISFRYARNLVEGAGLVFNPGERVEGFTNLLWTLLSALAIAAGAHPALAMLAISVVALAVLVWLSARLAARGREPSGFPIAAIIVALNVTMLSFGTSGLETMGAALLVLAAVERAEAGKPSVSGMLGTLAVLTHPDHAIFYAGLGASIAIERDRRALLRYAAPFVLLYLPSLAFRFGYYGEWLPNTYYAKSGGLSYFSQGVPYVVVSVVASGIVALLPLAIVGAVTARRRHLARFALFGIAPYLIYVAKVGGDFMLGRLLVSVVAPLAVLAELGFVALRDRDRNRLASGLLALALLAALPTHTLRPGEKFHHIADEQSFYTVESWSPLSLRSTYQRWADAFRRRVVEPGLSPVLAVGCLGILGYETGLFVVDTFGLTEKIVARQPLLTRGRPGHEKRPSPEYLVARGVDLSDEPILPREYDLWTKFSIEGHGFFLGRYTPAFADRLRQDASARVPDVPRRVDAYQPPGAGGSLDCDLWFMETFYFAYNDDPGRLASLREKLVRADPAMAGYEEFLLRDPPAHWQPVRRFNFSTNDRARWKMDGPAFSVVTTAVPGQRTVTGQAGAFATSFASAARDGAVGRMSRRFVVEGDVLTLRVAGGGRDDGVGVHLIADGKVVRATHGCRWEGFGRRVWPVAEWRGREVTLEVADVGSKGWSHIAVDEVVQWRRRSD